MDDRGRTQVEDLEHRSLDLLVRDRAGAEGLHEHTDGLRLADRVGDLDLAAAGQARGDDVLGHPAHRVRRGAVDLRGVLARERATTVTGHAAVGVDDDLAPGQTGVTHRTTDHERAGRVHQQAVAVGVDVELLEHRGDHVLGDVGLQAGVEVDAGLVLGGEHHGVDADRAGLVVVLDGDLGLPVGTQVGQRAVLADRREPLRERLGDLDRQRHQLGGVVAGVAEHQPLVTGALLVHRVDGLLQARLVAGVDALGDVTGLATDRDHDAAGRAVEALVGVVVADVEDLLTHDRLDVDVAGRGHLAGHHHQSRGQQRLDRDPRVRVLAQHLVEDSVADLVGDLVRVTLGHGLGGEQASRHAGQPRRRPNVR